MVLTSIPDKFCLERTSRPFSCGEYHMRWYGSSMDQVETAIYESRPAVGRLNVCQGSIVGTDEVRI